MRYLPILFIFLFLFSGKPEVRSQKQGTTVQGVPPGFVISPQEQKVYEMINAFRSGYNLPPIPLSRSLSFVASTHVKDLFFNHPDQPPCNFHSWSNRGNWKPFCYPRDEKKNNSVWDKPKELTGYKGKAYEIIYWENNAVNIDSIIPFWNSIDYFSSFLLNTGKWQEKKWMAIGIGIYENYAAAWFGEVSEKEETEPATALLLPVVEKTVPVRAVEKKHKVKSDTTAPVSKSVEPAPGIYYIIVSSQQPREKSNKLADELIAKGYPDAKVLAKENKVRVSIVELSTKPQADSALREIKKRFKDAWILKEKNSATNVPAGR
jgi:hypothetical protein